MKKCSKCGLTKPLLDFYIRKSGDDCGRPIEKCKICSNRISREFRLKNGDKIRESQNQRRKENPEKARVDYRKWRAANRDRAVRATKRWQEANPERNWYKENRVKAAEQARVRKFRRYHSDHEFRLKHILRERIRAALKRGVKSARTIELIGCPINRVISWIESLFLPGMSWLNYGKWHVDHKLPCASFDLTCPKQQRECFHYTNLQPLWAIDNLKKSDKLPV